MRRYGYEFLRIKDSPETYDITDQSEKHVGTLVIINNQAILHTCSSESPTNLGYCNDSTSKLYERSDVFKLAAESLGPYKSEETDESNDYDYLDENISGTWIVVTCSGSVKFFNDTKALYEYLSDMDNLTDIRSMTRV